MEFMTFTNMNEIEQHIQQYFGIGQQNLSKVADFFKPQSLSKGEFYLKSGKYQTNLSFIKTGYLRMFADSPNGAKEVTQWIAGPNSFVTDLSCLVFGTPAKWKIQALSDCELYTISQADYRNLEHIIPKWAQLEKRFLSKCFNTLEDRTFSHLSMNSEERYQMLFAYNQEMFNHVPLQYIASMLGMTPETFSRIRKKLSKNLSS